MNITTRSRRLAVVVGTAAAAALLAACGGSSSTGGGTSGSSSGAASAASIDVGTGTISPVRTDKIAIMIDAPKTFSFPAAIAQGAQDAAAKAGVSLDVYYSNFDTNLEQSNFNQVFATDKYGALIIHAMSPTLCKTIADGSVTNQILVTVITNPLCGQATATGEGLWSPGTITMIGGQNNVDGIAKIFDSAATKLGSGPKRVMLVMGPQGHPSTVAWEFAFKEFQKSHPDWSIAKEVYTEFSTPDAFAKTQNALQADANVDAIFTLYVDVSVGVVKALAAQKLSIPLYENGGGSKVSVQMLQDGTLTGTLPVYPYDTGVASVTTTVAALKGTQPPKFIDGDGNPTGAAAGVITKDNLSSFTPQW